MDAPKSIPPIFRDRIAGTLAFPLGYELLVSCLGDLKQWQKCGLGFFKSPTLWASDFAAILTDNLPYPICRIRHRSEAWASYRGSRGFDISVFPVRRELRSAARASFLASAQSAFRAFLLNAPDAPNFRDMRQAIFDPVTATCTVPESGEDPARPSIASP